MARTVDSGGRGTAEPLPSGAHAGQEDGQGPHLLAGDQRSTRTSTPPRSGATSPGFGKFGKRGVGYNIDALLGRDPQDPPHPGPAQHRAVRRRPPRPGDRQLDRSSPSTASTSQRCSTAIPTRSASRSAASRSARPPTSTTLIREQEHHRRRPRRPRGAAQASPTTLVAAGVKIIFNYSEALLDVPQDVTVHTTNPAVELLYALYFYLT